MSYRPLARVLLALLLPLLAPQAGGQNDADRVRALVNAALGTPGAVGLSVAVARGADLVFEDGAGTAELEHGVPANAGTMFRIGSITKQFTAAAIVRLYEDGELDVDEDMTAYLPDFYPAPPEVVTVRHLLTHTSGIPSYTGLGPVWGRTIPLELSHEELCALFQDRPLEFRPGSGWSYNNSGYYLLGMILEEVTGQDYGTHLMRTFFKPLGLARTRLGSNGDVIPNRAQGYRYEDGAFLNDALIGMSQPGAAGALLSTAGDLVRWQLALVGGRVVEPASYEEMTTPFLLEDGTETTYGFGLVLDELDGHRRVHHGGGIHGFNSELAWYPDAKLCVAVISNSEGYRAGELATAIARALLTSPVNAASSR